MKPRWLLLPLLVLLAGCATARPTPVDFPPLSSRPLIEQSLPDLPLKLSLDPAWTLIYNRFGDFLWRGSERPAGRPEMRLTISEDCRQSLPELVEGAARLRGLEAPSPAKPITVADREGYSSSGIQGVVQWKIVAIGWREEQTTFLLVASWVEPEDGSVLAAMIDSFRSKKPRLDEIRR